MTRFKVQSWVTFPDTGPRVAVSQGDYGVRCQAPVSLERLQGKGHLCTQSHDQVRCSWPSGLSIPMLSGCLLADQGLPTVQLSQRIKTSLEFQAPQCGSPCDPNWEALPQASRLSGCVISGINTAVFVCLHSIAGRTAAWPTACIWSLAPWDGHHQEQRRCPAAPAQGQQTVMSVMTTQDPSTTDGAGPQRSCPDWSGQLALELSAVSRAPRVRYT
jgi:hypothetical protein